jgi:hypothetical protein
MKISARACWLQSIKRTQDLPNMSLRLASSLQLSRFPLWLYELVDLTARERYENRRQPS